MLLASDDRLAYVGLFLTQWFAMTRSRSELVSPEDTRWYHCVSRCVRRAFLCGSEPSQGRSFDHRRAWVIDRLKELNNTFAVDIAAYAVMSNHYHLVLHLNPERAAHWSDREVLRRWTTLFAGPPIVREYLASGEGSSNHAIREVASQFADTCRKRLQDLSWYIRLLNESISRKANLEDQCSGRFWEGRFKSQALLDESALLAAMVYVDLNPVRAGLAATPEQSAYTSIHERLSLLQGNQRDTLLMPFDPTGKNLSAIPFALKDYLTLVDWAGRQHRDGKRGAIAQQQLPILQRIGMNDDAFLTMSGQLLKTYGSAIGSPATIGQFCKRRDLRYLRGTVAVRQAAKRTDPTHTK